MPCLKRPTLVYEDIPNVRRHASRLWKRCQKPVPPEDGISLDGLYPVAAAEDDDEISFVTSRH